MSGQTQANTPTKGCGLKGLKRSHSKEEEPLGSTKPKRKPRKKVAQKKRLYRRKQHKTGNAGNSTAEEGLPDVGVQDADIVECMFSDDEVCISLLFMVVNT